MKSRILIAAFGVALLLACNKPDPGQSPVVGPEDKTTYKVGDFYSEGLARGVVVAVDNSAEHGLLISLSEGQAKWSTENVFLFYTFMPQSFSRDDGSRNMTLIKTLDNWTSKYPAFAWCNKLNMGSSTSWYLPSVTEGEKIVAAIRAHESEINAALESNSGVKMSATDFYWTSEEATASAAYSFGVLYEGDIFSNHDKTATLRVRAVRKF